MEIDKSKQGWEARAVRRRLADHRLAAELIARGWICRPPADEIERRVRAAEVRKAAARPA